MRNSILESNKINITLASGLIILSILLTLLIPGGPIETRDFSQYSTAILTTFNTFLTILGVSSFFVAYMIIKRKKYSINIALAIFLLYLIVYLSDLLKIFPVSYISMPILLMLIELISTILTLPLIYLSIIYINTFKNDEKNISRLDFFLSVEKALFFILILFICIGIIVFATLSASHSSYIL